MSDALAGIDVLPWADFRDELAGTWRQGEHVSMIGPTGSGKTTLALGILDIRAYVIALATKPRDATMDRLIRGGWRKIKAWPPPPIIGDSARIVLWPPFRKPEDVGNQQRQLDYAIRAAFTEGGWTIFADELFYLCRTLKMAPLLETLWTQGRSIDVTLVGGTQRPAHVPLMAYDQATHLFFWRDNDETNLRRIAGLGAWKTADIRATVSELPKHSVLYLNTRTGRQLITRAER